MGFGQPALGPKIKLVANILSKIGPFKNKIVTNPNEVPVNCESIRAYLLTQLATEAVKQATPVQAALEEAVAALSRSPGPTKHGWRATIAAALLYSTFSFTLAYSVISTGSIRSALGCTPQ